MVVRLFDGWIVICDGGCVFVDDDVFRVDSCKDCFDRIVLEEFWVYN